MRLCDAQGACLCVKNDFNSSVSFHPRRLSAVLLALGLEGRAACVSAEVGTVPPHFITLPSAQWSHETAQLQKAENSKNKRQRSIIELNILWKYSSCLCLSVSVFLSVLQIIHPICCIGARHFQLCGEVHSSKTHLLECYIALTTYYPTNSVLFLHICSCIINCIYLLLLCNRNPQLCQQLLDHINAQWYFELNGNILTLQIIST